MQWYIRVLTDVRNLRKELNMLKNSNRIKLSEHFSLHEFANKDGLAIVHPRLVEALEKLRKRLAEVFEEECYIVITNATRTEFDNEILGRRLGWTDEGGLVSRNSKHLTKYGGIAVDFYVRRVSDSGYVSQGRAGSLARKFFDKVVDTYADGHIHADLRDLTE